MEQNVNRVATCNEGEQNKNKSEKEVFIMENTNEKNIAQEEEKKVIPFEKMTITQIRKFLGFQTIVLFKIVKPAPKGWHGSKWIEEHEIRCYKSKDQYEKDVEDHLKELNKRKRRHFWKATALTLNVAGFEKLVNETTSDELKTIKYYVAKKLGAENYFNMIIHVNRHYAI